jgi:tetratricopeptide (TPR) repeat protein
MPPSTLQHTVLRRVELLMQQGQFDAAEASCHAIITQNPKAAGAWAFLGILGLQKRDVSAAIQALVTAVQLDPNDASSWYHLSIASQQAGRLSEAEEYCRKAIALSAADADFWLQLGNVLFSARTICGVRGSLSEWPSRESTKSCCVEPLCGCTARTEIVERGTSSIRK